MVSTKEEFILVYWEYYLLLEDEFINIEKIIPVDTINKNTFSSHYMRILFSLCSEIDVIFKEFIEYNNWFTFSSANGNFGKYKDIILRNEPNFSNEVLMFSGARPLKPFDSWNSNTKPSWWDDYNNIKHNRTLKINGIENYKKANQENALNALCALYQIEMYFYKSIINKNNILDRLRMPVPQSKRIRIHNWQDNRELLEGTSKNHQTETNLPCIFFDSLKQRYTVNIKTLFYVSCTRMQAEGAPLPLPLGFRPHNIGIPRQIVCHVQ